MTCQYNADSIKTAFAENNLTVIQDMAFQETDVMPDDVIDDYLGIIGKTARSRLQFYVQSSYKL